ncbi:MAG TPA: hypothetical protein VJ689_08050, partial [Gaiellaceae bacterium]|nr:hypothetical protein [Gaiellaceae bacterium]
MQLSLTLLTRPGRASAIVAVVGLLGVAQGAMALRWQASGFGWDRTGAVAAALLVLALAGSAMAMQALVPLIGRRGKLGLLLARIGLVAILAGELAARGIDGAFGVVALVGLGVSLLGLMLVSGAARRAGEVAPWTPAVAAGGLALVVLVPGGAIGLGLAWLAVALSFQGAA